MPKCTNFKTPRLCGYSSRHVRCLINKRIDNDMQQFSNAQVTTATFTEGIKPKTKESED